MYGKEVEKLIELYFEMNDGEHIKNFQNEIIIFQKDITIKITHRVLKHIVEQRKKDNYSVETLQLFFVDIVSILDNKNYDIVENKDISKNSFLLIEKVFDKKIGVVLVLEIIVLENNAYFIKTGFYRAVTKIKKLLN